MKCLLTISFCCALCLSIAQTSPVRSLPPGVRDGINYISSTKVVLCLLAPHKQYVYVIGDFNDWQVSDKYLMKKTHDGERYWIEIDGLEPKREYRFQYFVDGQIRVGDPYADKWIDDSTDKDIAASVYPDLIGYPTGKTTYPVSVLQTGQLPFPWKMDDFTPVPKEKMFIYELCVRDFTAAHSYDGIRDTLDYLQRLGVNVIELMPVTDFEGNLSWGYNPNYYFAPDKYFGPKNELKKLIDECHNRGIAVVLDMVLNHSWGQNPLVRLYWNDSTKEPTSESPWFNVGSNFANPLAHFGPDYDHESPYSQEWVDSVNSYWISEYKVDGFRFDFTKGFTNKYKPLTDLWGDEYDASRVAILKRMASSIWKTDPKTLVILEHLSFNNQEEKELADYGMMMWANFKYHFTKLIQGDSAEISWINYTDRDWSQPNAVAYWSSHDWERIMFDALSNGRSNRVYDTRDLSTALDRLKMCAAFLFTVPGPKMIWMFDELGYDISKDVGGYGKPKPARWDYFQEPGRNKLYKAIEAIIHLKQHHPVFSSKRATFTSDGIVKSMHIDGNEMNVTVIGNFDIVDRSIVTKFQHTGSWYDYFTGESYDVDSTDQPYSLRAGEFHIFLDKQVDFPEPGLVPFHITSAAASHATSSLQYVDPFIGTDGTGHTYPGATLPFGMVQVGPDTGFGEWKHCAGYHYTDTTILGFSHTHLSGTGVGDLGDIMLQPISGKVRIDPGVERISRSGYRSGFSHEQEKASPGYYQVKLLDDNINVELTATERAGFHRYTFARDDSAHVVLDLSHKVVSEQGGTKWAFVMIVNDSTVMGYRISHAWAAERYVYFAIKFDKPFSDFSLYRYQERITPEKMRQASGDSVVAVFHYSSLPAREINLRVGLSAVSMENALANLQNETTHKSFDEIRTDAENTWSRQLAKIEIEGSERTKRIFYTALYHSMLAPTVYMDADGSYRGVDNQIHKRSAGRNYSVFSLWDTFRATHPLFTIVHPDRVNDMINSMLDHFDQSVYKELPHWSLHANETWTMIGYHAAPVIADAYLKGFNGFDPQRALNSMKISATKPTREMQEYANRGYVPIDVAGEAASKTLEYAYDDWAIAAMATKLGNKNDVLDFKARALNYKNVFDRRVNFMRARLSSGQFKSPFDPFYMRYGGDYTEGNAWQYSWFVPHDVTGLIGLMGGRKFFSAKLDSLFIIKPILRNMKGEVPYDVNALIGQYAHGNEPSHHIAYLYNFVDESWKTQKMVHRIMNELYNDKPNGFSGNEDCGQMSAWYIFSALGFYPVNPVGGVYHIGTPQVNNASIQVPGKKTFRVHVLNPGETNYFIKSVTLNGKPLRRPYITHNEIMAGGVVEFRMSDKPVKTCFAPQDWKLLEQAFVK